MDALSAVQATSAKINALGSVYYFDPATLARGKEIGLDGFRFYILGRGGVMGDVPAEIVTSAFGYFNDDMIAKMWNTAKERVSASVAAEAYLAANAAIGEERLSGLAELEAFDEAATEVVRSTNLSALPLFAGFAAQPRPEHPAARALHLAVVLRELRGSQHLVAVVASGLDPAVAHAIKRPDMVEGFGYAELPSIPDDAAERLAAAEQLTDRLQAESHSGLSSDQLDSFVAGVDAMHAKLEL